MSKAIITEQHLHDIADAIIAKGGATAPMTPAQMAVAISSKPDAVIPRKVVGGRVGGDTDILVYKTNFESTYNYALAYAFPAIDGRDYKLERVDMSSIVKTESTAPFYYSFYNCKNIVSVDLSNLSFVRVENSFAYTFQGCVKLESVDFSSLKAIGCNASGDFGNGYAHFHHAFNGCTSLLEIRFPELEYIYQGNAGTSRATFYNCNKVQKMFFPRLHSIFGNGDANIFNGCNELEELHFGAENESVIKSLNGWSTLWGLGAGAATVYFDL